ncbi:hypothetical protein N7540_013023 [Penicillium herquei]|nr:hypothetical protein N7540_013023 [Penicillium herquei]
MPIPSSNGQREKMHHTFDTLIAMSGSLFRFSMFTTLVSVSMLLLAQMVTSYAALDTSTWLFCCSMLTAIISCMTSLMLRFHLSAPTVLDLVVIWLPLTLLDIAVVLLAVGVNYWCCEGNCGQHTRSSLYGFVSLGSLQGNPQKIKADVKGSHAE